MEPGAHRATWYAIAGPLEQATIRLLTAAAARGLSAADMERTSQWQVAAGEKWPHGVTADALAEAVKGVRTTRQRSWEGAHAFYEWRKADGQPAWDDDGTKWCEVIPDGMGDMPMTGADDCRC